MTALVLRGSIVNAQSAIQVPSVASPLNTSHSFTDAGNYGFSPEASGMENTKALQRAVDLGGTIIVARPGVYKIAGTIFIGGNTSLKFGNNVFLKKVDEQGAFTHVLLNKGALTKTYDEHIAIEGLQIIVNGVDVRNFLVYGLHGQLAFFYAQDIRIEHFRCLDLGKVQYGIQVCTFEDLQIHDVIIKGDKDGVHLGRGKRFSIRDGIFQTFDDAVALNGHDYATGNPELGWIEDGVVENCHDLNAEKTTGYFCRILAGAWIDWRPGMEVQQSDTVVSVGRLYRVQAKPDGSVYKSITRPTFESGSKVLDGINWGVVQAGTNHTAGVRNLVFRDIFLEKPRVAFSIHFDIGKYSRSYYPGAPIPVQQNIYLENVHVMYGENKDFLLVSTPVDVVTMSNCSLCNNSIHFVSNKAMSDYGPTAINLVGCVFNHPGPMNLLVNQVAGKFIHLKTTASVENPQKSSTSIVTGGGNIKTESDLPGLNQAQPSTTSDEQKAQPATTLVETDKRLNSNGKPWRLEQAKILDPQRPRVLLIGDSILNGYLSNVVKQLDGIAYVDAWVNPYWQSPQVNHILADILTNGTYSVICFNLGLHGWPKGRIEEGAFVPLTRAYVEVLKAKQPQAALIWDSTTPVLQKRRPALDPEINCIILEQNRLAAGVMSEMNIPVNDLYSVVLSRLNLGAGDGFHWQAEAYHLLADAVTGAIKKNLSARN